MKISDTSKKFRIKDCHLNSQTFSIYLRSFDRYLHVPFEGITAFPNGYDPNLNIQKPSSAVGYEPASDTNSTLNDCQLRQELRKQININDDLENKITSLKQEIANSEIREQAVCVSNTDMISKIENLKKEFDSLKEKHQTVCLQKEQETKYKDNYKKWNSTLSVENTRMKDIKADMKHLQQLQVDIDVQRAEAIQMLTVLDKKHHKR